MSSHNIEGGSASRAEEQSISQSVTQVHRTENGVPYTQGSIAESLSSGRDAKKGIVCPTKILATMAS
jgi:hypothetical protein